jgi:ABC-type oligopeptide transport system ATPase subunit
VVVADDAAYQRRREIQLVYRPPYSSSPCVNPDQQVWNHAKRQLGKPAILSHETLENAVYRILRSLQKEKPRGRSSFWRHQTHHISDIIK